MSGVNKAIIIGRLGADPEFHHAPSGATVARANIATSEQWRDKNTGEKQEKTEWHRVVFFGRLSEIVNEYLKKGAEVFVEGRIETNKWTDEAGAERYSTQIVALNMQMLGGRSASPAQDPGTKPEDENQDAPFVDDIPF